jgi:ribosomal protein S18 acetylase RimI-like enzyme
MDDAEPPAVTTTDERRPVAEQSVPPGSDERASAVWACKERIRRLEGLLVQRRPVFDAIYRQATCHLAVAVPGDVVAAFALVQPDGYLSLLGVAPAYRHRGLGGQLLARVVDDHPEIHCHVRASNDRALGFYLDHEFVVDRRVSGYYRDGTDAYRLVRDPERARGVADVVE